MMTRELHMRKSSERAFTLLEVLMATVMYAIIVGAMYTVFHGAMRLRENAYETFENKQPTYYTIDTIKRDLLECVGASGLLAGSMIGESEEESGKHFDRLEFHTASARIDAYQPWGDIQRVTYALSTAQEWESPLGYVLVRSIERNLLSPIEELPVEERLMGDIDSLQFMYYDGEEWWDAWDSTQQDNELPTLISVRIDFRLPVDDEKQMLPIEFAVPILVKAQSAIEESEDGEEDSESTENQEGQGGQNQQGQGGGQDVPSGGEGGGGGRP